MPKTRRSVCNKRPLVRPRTVFTPALIPSEPLLMNTYIISGPGLTVKIIDENKKTKRVSICIIFDSI